MDIKETENLIRIIRADDEINMEEEKKKFIKNSIDHVEEILSKYNCICINKEHAKSCMHATIGYDFSFISQSSDATYIFNLFRPNILFDKKDYFNEMEKRGYKNLIIDFTNFCIRFDVDYIYSGKTYRLVDRSENNQEETNV